jgi:hypothetical protein
MPVTAVLSKLFYDRLGEQVANELVNWFNAVDDTYRSDLRELNELNFARFDAKLEQRVAELHAKLDTRIEKVAGELNAKIDKVAGELNAKIDKVASELNARIDKVDARIDLTAAELRETIQRAQKEQVRWMFVSWLTLLMAIIGLWMRP